METTRVNRRRAARHRMLHRARAVFNNGHGTLDCIVLDLSETGARLRLGGWMEVPEVFELRLDNGVRHLAEVRYRLPGVIGVRFGAAAAG